MAKLRENRRAILRESIVRLTVCAMLIALYIVVNRYLTINVSPGVKIGLSFIAPMIAAMLYGPATGAAVYGLGDLLSALILPQGPYHPGFTLTAALMGLLWGVFTHPNPFVRFQNRALTEPGRANKVQAAIITFFPAALNCLVLGLFVNSLWLSQLYGSKTYWGWLLSRVPQEALMTAVNCAVAVLFLPVAQLLRKRGFVKPLKKPAKTE